ncbi:MAG: actin family protein [Acidobacteriota bacterium]
MSTVIIDFGSGYIKAGYAENDQPTYLLETEDLVVSVSYVAVGSNVSQVGRLKLSGHEDDTSVLWRHILASLLRVDPAESSVLMLDAPNSDPESRASMAESLFEEVGVQAMHVMNQAEAALFSSGRTTGVVVDCGDRVSHIVPIVEGATIPDAITRIELGGRSIDNYLARLLAMRGMDVSEADARSIKEELAYVARDLEQEIERSQHQEETMYSLANGETIIMADELFRCSEVLFRPGLMNHAIPGIQQAAVNSIMASDESVRAELFDNIFLSGGTSLLSGLGERMQAEVAAVAPSGATVNVTTAPDGRYAPWIGGSRLVSSPSFEDRWISQDEYGQHGDEVVHSKCGS